MSTIGEKIKNIRQLRGWTQAEVAANLKISTPAFSKIETGATDINLSRLDQIARFFDMPVIELMTWEQEVVLPVENPKLIAALEKLTGLEAEIKELEAMIIVLYTHLSRTQ